MIYDLAIRASRNTLGKGDWIMQFKQSLGACCHKIVKKTFHKVTTPYKCSRQNAQIAVNQPRRSKALFKKSSEVFFSRTPRESIYAKLRRCIVKSIKYALNLASSLYFSHTHSSRLVEGLAVASRLGLNGWLPEGQFSWRKSITSSWRTWHERFVRESPQFYDPHRCWSIMYVR